MWRNNLQTNEPHDAGIIKQTREIKVCGTHMNVWMYVPYAMVQFYWVNK